MGAPGTNIGSFKIRSMENHLQDLVFPFVEKIIGCAETCKNSKMHFWTFYKRLEAALKIILAAFLLTRQIWTID